jgi:uncharacterized protein (DUF983 family)
MANLTTVETMPATLTARTSRRALRCPRCGGNVLLNRYEGEGALSCLQCGRAYRLVSTPSAGSTSHAA